VVSDLFVALFFLVCGYLGGRYFPIGMASGHLQIWWYGTGLPGESMDFFTSERGFARDSRWLADQLRQIADTLDGGPGSATID
jgi:hypothetical protein